MEHESEGTGAFLGSHHEDSQYSHVGYQAEPSAPDEVEVGLMDFGASSPRLRKSVSKCVDDRKDAPRASAPPGEDVGDEEKLCRICFDGEAEGEMIAPCRCAGGQRWIHRTCLNDWRSQEQIPHAFERCPTCHFNYVTEVITSEPTNSQLLKYRLLVTRDIFAGVFAVASAMLLLGLICSFSDPGPKRPLLHIVLNKPIKEPLSYSFWPYTVCGAFLFLALFGLVGVFMLLAEASAGNPCYGCDCGPCIYTGDGCCCCCEGAGEGCAGCADCEVCGAAAEGEGALACIVIAVIVLAAIGIFVGIGFAVAWIKGVLDKHMQVLWLRGEAERVVVVDLSRHPEHLNEAV